MCSEITYMKSHVHRFIHRSFDGKYLAHIVTKPPLMTYKKVGLEYTYIDFVF